MTLGFTISSPFAVFLTLLPLTTLGDPVLGEPSIQFESVERESDGAEVVFIINYRTVEDHFVHVRKGNTWEKVLPELGSVRVSTPYPQGRRRTSTLSVRFSTSQYTYTFSLSILQDTAVEQMPNAILEMFPEQDVVYPPGGDAYLSVNAHLRAGEGLKVLPMSYGSQHALKVNLLQPEFFPERGLLFAYNTPTNLSVWSDKPRNTLWHFQAKIPTSEGPQAGLLNVGINTFMVRDVSPNDNSESDTDEPVVQIFSVARTDLRLFQAGSEGPFQQGLVGFLATSALRDPECRVHMELEGSRRTFVPCRFSCSAAGDGLESVDVRRLFSNGTEYSVLRVQQTTPPSAVLFVEFVINGEGEAGDYECIAKSPTHQARLTRSVEYLPVRPMLIP